MRSLIALALLLSGCAQQNGVEIVQAWSRATPPGAGVGVIYLDLINHGPMADRLLSVTSDAADKIELHATRMEGGMMSMRPIAALDLPVGEQVRLAPEGIHIMLMGLRAPLVAGTNLNVKLAFQQSPPRTVSVAVRALGATPD